MPLTALISDAMKQLSKLLPQMPSVHLTAATVQEAMSAIFVFTSPETILDGTGRMLLQTPAFAHSLRTVFIDEFHVVKHW